MFVRGSTTKREEEVADAARTANPDEIDIDDEEDDEDDDDDDDGDDGETACVDQMAVWRNVFCEHPAFSCYEVTFTRI